MKKTISILLLLVISLEISHAQCNGSLDLGYAYEFSNRSSNIALKENNHELFVRFKFSNSSKQVASLDSTQSF